VTDSASPAAQVAVVGLDSGDEGAIADFYARVVVPHFRPDELSPERELAEYLRAGKARALVARTGQDAVAGGAYCDWFAGSRVLLLSYLAVLPDYRDLGIGALLLGAVRGEWAADLRPLLIVAEVEDPRFYHDAAFGDPSRRARFYERAGARVLSLPYLQPALNPDTSRVPHLMLMVLGGSVAPPGAHQVDGQLIESFLTEYYAEAEGQVSPDDTAVQALLAACRRPGGLPLLPVSELP
jgi:GNAT superfamily N-acetyltransferase